MKTLRITLAAAVLGLSCAAFTAPAGAATAHNSQAGGLGNSSNASAPSGMAKRMRMARKHRKHM